MTNEQWLESLRKRTHETANYLQGHESRLIRIEERQSELNKKIAQLDSIKISLAELRHQSTVLKWVLGFVSALTVGCLVKLIP